MMIVTFFLDSGKKNGFQVSGHSDYRRDGEEDILCAAVSTLVTNTANAIETLTKDCFEHLAVNEEEGFFSMKLVSVSPESALLLDALELGIKSIRESYEEFIEIRYLGGKSC